MGSRSQLARLAPPLLLLVTVAVLYAQSATQSFIDYDTSTYLTGNPHVLSGLSLANLRWAFTNFEAANWHPLTWLSHQLDVELFGLRPAGHQLENAAWHAANALLVLALFSRLGLSRAFAFTGAFFFAAHPLRAESVAWIVERKDLLCAFFGLATLLAWLSWSREPKAWKLVAALVLYAFSLMSKAMLVTLPCLLVLLDFWPLGRAGARPRRSDLAKLPFVLLALGACYVTLRAQAEMGAVQGFGTMPLRLRVETALDSYVWYAAKTCWPSGLAFHYPIVPQGLRFAALLGDALVFAALCAGTWLARGRLPGLLFGWLWYLGTLVPVIGLVQVGGQAHAERYTYLPCLGLAFALALVAERELWPRLRTRVLAGLGCVAGLALGVQASRQVATWHDTEALARHALSVTRDNYVANDILGAYYSEAGRFDEALPLLREAVRIAPSDPDSLANLGATLLRHEEYPEAEELLLRVSRLVPARAQSWSLLGYLYFKQRRLAESLLALDEALARDAQHVVAWSTRGLTLEALGRLDEAVAALQHALELRPDLLNAQLALGRLLLRLGRSEEARAHFEAALRIEPGNFDALRGFERVELAAGALERALALAQAAERVRPGSAPALADQAWILALAREGPLAQPAQALELARRAVAISGEQPALLDALALALAANGDFAAAAAAAEKALGFVRGADPDWAERLEKRLAAYRAGRIDREPPR